MKQARGTGFFLYGNHTNAIADALIPTMLRCPLGAYVIVHANNVSMPILGKITPCLGAIPLPDDKVAMKNFNEAIEHLVEKKQCITIYPDDNKNKAENAMMMMQKNYEVWKEIYEETYGIPLSYSCDE